MIQVYDIVKIKLSEQRKYKMMHFPYISETEKSLLDSDGNEFYIAGISHSQDDEMFRTFKLARIGSQISELHVAYHDIQFCRKPTEDEFKMMLPVQADAPVFEQIEKMDEKQMELF